jgi:hypothetical protein
MEIELRDLVYIIIVVVTCVLSFHSSMYKMKDLVHEKNEILLQNVNDLRLDLERHNGRLTIVERNLNKLDARVYVLISNKKTQKR